MTNVGAYTGYRSVDAIVHGTLDSCAVGVLGGWWANVVSQNLLTVQKMLADLSRGVSAITVVISTEVSIITEGRSVHRLMYTTKRDRISGNPRGVAGINHTSIVGGTVGHISGSTVRIDLPVSSSILSPITQSSAYVIFTAIQRTDLYVTLTSVASLLRGEALILRGLAIVATEFCTCPVHTSGRRRQSICINLRVHVISWRRFIVQAQSNTSVKSVGCLSGDGLTRAVGEDADTVNVSSLAGIGSVVAYVDGATSSIIAVGVLQTVAVAHVLVALSGGGVTKILFANNRISRHCSTTIDGDGVSRAGIVSGARSKSDTG